MLVCKEKSAQSNIFFMEKSCFIWLGEMGIENPPFGSLITAIQTKYDPFPISKTLILPQDDEIDESTGSGIGQRLSKKFGIQTFISYNLPNSFQRAEVLMIEKLLIDILRKHFEKSSKIEVEETEESSSLR